MDIKTVTINLKNLMNKWFYTREQIHQLLEDYVTVDNNGILKVGLPSAEKITLTTQNNAITTADVAEVTAKVTDSNNNATFGVPVQFVNRATREVLYSGSTDENGEIDFQYFTEEAEILPIQAKISNDYVFRDDGRLNSYTAWGRSNNVTIQHISTHSIVSRADTSSSPVGTLETILLSGYCDIDFKVKIPSDGSTNIQFCRIVEQTSTGNLVDNGSRNNFKLSDLNLTTEKWYNFHISVLDDRIVLYCKDTGETKRIWLDEAYPYYRFQLIVSSSVPTICFSDMKITRCSDDLSMFIKDTVNIAKFNMWAAGDYTNDLTDITTGQAGQKISISKEYSYNGDYSYKIFRDPSENNLLWTLFNFPQTTLIDEIYELRFNVLLVSGSVDFWFGESVSNGLRSSTRLNGENTNTTIVLSRTITSSTNTLQLRVNSVTDNVILFIDNINIVKMNL